MKSLITPMKAEKLTTRRIRYDSKELGITLCENVYRVCQEVIYGNKTLEDIIK